jgi:hypothetical protein
MRRAPWAAVCLLVAAAIAPIAAAPAGGGANTTVTVRIAFTSGEGEPSFTGRVKSGRESCVPGRLVRVFRQQNKRRIFFGADRSDSSGFWQLAMNARMRTGGYVAVAKAKPGCLKGVSDPIAVGQRGPGGVG